MLCIDELNDMKQCYYSYFIDEGRETCWILVALPNLHSQCVSKILLFIAQLCPALCDPMDCSTPGFPVLHHLPEFAQNHVHWVSDPIQQSHPLISLMLYEITNMSFPLKKAVSMEQTGLDHQGYTRLHLKELSGFVALASTTMHRKIYLRIPLSLKQVCHFIYDSNKFTFSTSLMDQEFCIPFVWPFSS